MGTSTSNAGGRHHLVQEGRGTLDLGPARAAIRLMVPRCHGTAFQCTDSR